MPTPDLAAVKLNLWEDAMGDDGSPELATEVASPSNRKLHRKADLYLENGARQVWIIYRKTLTVAVVTARGTTEARIGDALEFQGVRVAVSDIFPQK